MKRRWMILSLLAVLSMAAIPATRAQAATDVADERVTDLITELTAKVRRIATRCNNQNTHLVRQAKTQIEELKGSRHGRLKIRHIIYTTSKRIRRRSHECIKDIREVCSQYIMTLEDLGDARFTDFPIVLDEAIFEEVEGICQRNIHRIKRHTEYLLERLSPERDSPESDGTVAAD